MKFKTQTPFKQISAIKCYLSATSHTEHSRQHDLVYTALNKNYLEQYKRSYAFTTTFTWRTILNIFCFQTKKTLKVLKTQKQYVGKETVSYSTGLKELSAISDSAQANGSAFMCKYITSRYGKP